ncbi:MAG: aldo/keto reductase [Cyclobacteriaceae bacterium]|nr:aldo/keto reductase [Cyclobacteriaceae bacterium]
MKKENQPSKSSRREFLQKTAVGVSAMALGADIIAKTTPWQQTGIPTRPLGSTGENVSIICLGGFHIGSVAKQDEKEAIKMMHTAIGEGVTFFDNSWDYHDGGSEEIMGKALAIDGMRKKAFLMTKNCDRDYAGSMKKLEDSLRRLKTDYVDLWQFHEIIYDNDPDWVFDKGGIKAAIEAQKAGKVRFIGFTGHKDPAIHLKMLNKEFDWDTAQMPINVMDAHYRSFQHGVVPECISQKVGVIGMKALGGGAMVQQAGLTAEECRRYALSQPISSLVCGMGSVKDMEQDIAIARNFKPMSSGEKYELEARVKDVAGDGRYELFKSAKNYDGGYHRKQHGFS